MAASDNIRENTHPDHGAIWVTADGTTLIYDSISGIWVETTMGRPTVRMTPLPHTMWDPAMLTTSHYEARLKKLQEELDEPHAAGPAIPAKQQSKSPDPSLIVSDELDRFFEAREA